MATSTKQNEYVHARIDANLTKTVVKILNKHGLSISEFIKLIFNQVVRDK